MIFYYPCIVIAPGVFVITVYATPCRKTRQHVLSTPPPPPPPPLLLQSVLGAEGLSLAFRHIVSSLLRYCSQQPSEELLHEVIVCVGYFTVNHPDNQVRAAEGTCPLSQNQSRPQALSYFSQRGEEEQLCLGPIDRQI